LYRFPHFLILASFLALAVNVLCATSQFPVADDYDVFLSFLINFKSNDSFNLSPFFLPHNEHLVAIPRLLAFIDSSLFGFHPAHLVIVPLGCIFATIYLFHKHLINTPSENATLVTLPAILIFLAPQPYEAWTWAIGSLQYSIPPLCALIASIFWFQDGIRNKIYAVIFILIASLTLISSPLILLSLICIAVIRQLPNKTQPSNPYVLLMIIGVLITSFVIKSSSEIAFSTLNLIGNGLSFDKRTASTLVGFFVLTSFIFALRSEFIKTQPALMGFFGSILLMILAIAYGRSGFGDNFILNQSRYSYLSLIAIGISISVFLIIIKTSVKLPSFITAISILILTFSWSYYWPNYIQRREANIDNLIAWNLDQTSPNHPNKDHANKILALAIDNEVILLPKVSLDTVIKSQEINSRCQKTIILNEDDVQRSPGKVYWDHYHHAKGYVFASGYQLPPKNITGESKFLLQLRDGDAKYLYQPSPRYRPDVRRTYGTKATALPGFSALIDLGKLTAGSYNIDSVWWTKDACFVKQHRKTEVLIEP